MLEKEFKFYLDNQEKFVKEFQGKFLVIKNDEVIGVYVSDEEAYFNTILEHEAGTFLIQFCDSGDSSYTQSFHSRVIFN